MSDKRKAFLPPKIAPTDPAGFIAGANADEPDKKKLLNASLNAEVDTLLRQLAALERVRLAEAMALALRESAAHLGEFAAFCREFRPPADSLRANAAYWVPVEVVEILAGLPDGLAQNGLAVSSKSKIARLAVYFAAHRRKLTPGERL